MDYLDELFFFSQRSYQVVENTSDGMDMYNLVLRKFKQIHYKQEQDRFFPVYDSETLGNSKVGYKKIC